MVVYCRPAAAKRALVRPAARGGSKIATVSSNGKSSSTEKNKKDAKSPKDKPGASRDSTKKQVKEKCAKFVEQFHDLADAACQGDHRLSSDPPVSRQLRAYRQRLMTFAKGNMKGPLKEAAAASLSLVLYTEALADKGTQKDSEVMLEAATLRKSFIGACGAGRWDEARVAGGHLLEALKAASVPTPQADWTEQAALRRARQLSVLHRLVSLAAGLKDGCVSRELSAMAAATVMAVRTADPTGCCAICLGTWVPEEPELGAHASPVLVMSCGHVYHVDCYWHLICAEQNGLRGQCRICLSNVSWGPLARANLRCTLAAAAAATGADTTEVAAAIAQEIGETVQAVRQDIEVERRNNPLHA
mmetsp:Transcript_53370/g.98693  ORF Transcript_53370/g.98693 Transcript_53370/m.98693 type:complete len:360 (-) Transcript_53370:117-1196(-)